jgi:chromosome segregation ATPase
VSDVVSGPTSEPGSGLTPSGGTGQVTPLTERLAALRERVAGVPEAPNPLGATIASLNRQQSELLGHVAALTQDVHELAPRLVAEAQELLDREVAGLREDVAGAREDTAHALRAVQQLEPAPDHAGVLAELLGAVHSLAQGHAVVGQRLDDLQATLEGLDSRMGRHEQALASAVGEITTHMETSSIAIVETLLSTR